MTRRLLLLLALLLIHPCAARAGMLLTPNGNPTGAARADGTGGSAILDPRQAFEETQPQVGPLSSDDLLVTALAAQGFGGMGWTFNFIALKGNDITLDIYRAWADSDPAINQSGVMVAAANAVGFGGAAIALNYKQNNNMDPATNTPTHWISVLEDNNPLQFEKDHGTADPLRPGYTLSIDNPFAPQDANGDPTTPFYDAGRGAANSMEFVDRPSDRLDSGTDLIFHTYLVTGEVATKTFNIYDDVVWGVDLAPEPDSFALLGLGAASLAGYAWRRRRAVGVAAA